MSIQVENITKTFGKFVALDHVSLDFPTGDLVALLGPSGCGKTTLLRVIAGLETADSGRVILEGEDASDTHVRERQVGFVFQHYALFRNLTVFENVAFGLRVRPRRTAPRRGRDPQARPSPAGSGPARLRWPTASRPSSPAASASASRSPARSRPSRACCCSTSRSAPWTPRCARSCGAGCEACTTSCR